MRKKLIVSTAMLIAALLVGMQYAKKNNTVTSKEAFALHDNGTAPGYNEISFNEMTKGLDDHTVNFTIPINVAVPKGSRSILRLKIPDSFQMFRVLDNGIMYEFVKKEELKTELRSEIIHVYTVPGARISSAIVMEKHKQSMQESVSGGIKTLEEKTEQYSNYTRSSSTFLMGEDESTLVVVRYFSGPYDNAQYQYLIGLGDGMSKEKALQKIANFEKECVEVIFG